ncbi:MAG TPA: MoxR family ATPase [Thermodesulfobacteriota bacterium]|nr:MoxR family ATPase [Thermodesulfobacteriota bacterium]
MDNENTAWNEAAAERQLKLAALYDAMSARIVGQKDLIRSIIICLLCDGHMLIEGMPGLAKTTAAKTLAEALEGDFQRIQFTPDLLPSDLIGTDIYLQETGEFSFRKGPLFNNIILADEINRAPAKVQSALLEAMEEKQVTVGLKTYKLPDLYMVLATQNPIEHEGTYNLPEAQLDRFLMQVVLDYPSHDEELEILKLDETLELRKGSNPSDTVHVVRQEDIFKSRDEVAGLYMDDKLRHYAVSLVSATRYPDRYSEKLSEWIQFGASPRATLGIVHCAKALAWLEGDSYVFPHHIQGVAANILRHRIIPTFEAEAEGVTRDRIISHLLEVVAIP